MGLHVFFRRSKREKIKPFIEKCNELCSFSIELDEPIADDLSKEFKISVQNNAGYLKINDVYNAKIFGDIEADLFPNKIENNEINCLFDAVKHGYISKEMLDALFAEFRPYLVKAYIDIDGDGEDNPLDVLYEYDPQGRSLFFKLVKVLQILAEEDEGYQELYELVRENSDRNILASRLWHYEPARNKAFSIARGKEVVAQEGSLKLYADDKEKMESYYREMIDQLIRPLFDIPSLDERLKRL